MPQQEFPVGAPCWIDLYTSDTDRARAFYGELFGWKSEAAGPEYGGYINCFKDGRGVAGMMHNDGSGAPMDLWSVYLAVDDAQKTADAVTANGGQVIVAPMDVRDLGTMAVFADAGGAAIGAWRPGENKGFGLLAEPGAPGWFELHTRDYDKTVQFYRDVNVLIALFKKRIEGTRLRNRARKPIKHVPAGAVVAPEPFVHDLHRQFVGRQPALIDDRADLLAQFRAFAHVRAKHVARRDMRDPLPLDYASGLSAFSGSWASE